jgi:hypothetical protein
LQIASCSFSFPFCEDVSATAQGSTLSVPMSADPTLQTMWTCRYRGPRGSVVNLFELGTTVEDLVPVYIPKPGS